MEPFDTRLTHLQNLSGNTQLMSDDDIQQLVVRTASKSHIDIYRGSAIRTILLGLVTVASVLMGTWWLLTREPGSSESAPVQRADTPAKREQRSEYMSAANEVSAVSGMQELVHASVGVAQKTVEHQSHQHAGAASTDLQNTQPSANTSPAEAKTPPVIQKPENLGTVKTMTLDSAELAALGVLLTRDSIVMEWEEEYTRNVDGRGLPLSMQEQIDLSAMCRKAFKYGYDTTQPRILYKSRVVFDVDGVNSRVTHTYTGWNPDEWSPNIALGVTSGHAQYSSISQAVRNRDTAYDHWNFTSGMYMIEQRSPRLTASLKTPTIAVNQMSNQQLANLMSSGVWEQYFLESSSIPIQVRLTNDHHLRKKAEATNTPYDSSSLKSAWYRLWFPITPEFIAALPLRYREPLQKEYGLYKQVVTGELSVMDACEKIQEQEHFTELCKATDGRIMSISVAPNPAKDFVNLKFSLVENCNAAIYLYDGERGTYNSDLAPTQWYHAGINERRIELGAKLRSGVYLVVLVTDKGEHAMQRIIVE